MLMPKQNKIKVYEHLLKEGVMVAMKDFYAPQHPEITDVPNIQVIKTMQSLKSRHFVKEQFAWRHYYWYLTNEGIEYLREVLHLPTEIVPATLRKTPRADPGVAGGRRPYAAGGKGDYGRDEREGYRHAPGGDDPKKDVGAGAAEISFRGGFGRGRPGAGAPPPQ